MALALKTSTVSAIGVARPGKSVSRAPLVVRAERDNPYHDRKHTHKDNPGGTKDINAVRQDKQDQYEYQQERLEWRRKNHAKGAVTDPRGGVDRDEPPHVNVVKGDDYSAENRGPEVEGTSDHKDTLKDLVKGITGQKKKDH